MVGSRRTGDEALFSGSKSSSWSGGKLVRVAAVTAVLGMSLAAFSLMASTTPITPAPYAGLSSDSGLFDDDGRYIMRNYDDIKPNSNFLAGLGGLWGVPMVRSVVVFSWRCYNHFNPPFRPSN